MKQQSELGPYDWIYEADNGEWVRVWITETTDKLKDSQKALVRCFKFHGHECDAVGEACGPEHAHVLTVNRETSDVESHLAEELERTVRLVSNLCVTNRSVRGIPKE